jgi:hypothetical protein
LKNFHESHSYYHKETTTSEKVMYIVFVVLVLILMVLLLLFFPDLFAPLNNTVAHKDTQPQQQEIVIKEKKQVTGDNIFITLELLEGENITLKLPRPGYYYQQKELTDQLLLYQYLKDLSMVLKYLANNAQVDSHELRMMSETLYNYALVLHSLHNYCDNRYLKNLKLNNPEFSLLLTNYLSSLDNTLSQIQDPNSAVETFYNNITLINQVNYAKTLAQVHNNINSDQKLPADVKLFANLINDEMRRICTNIQLKLPSEKLEIARPVVTRMIDGSKLDESSKMALRNAIELKLDEASNTEIFVNTLLIVLNSDKDSLNRLPGNQKDIILKTIQSISVENRQSLKEVITPSLPIEFVLRKSKFNHS